jgi:hypothetical protein
MALTEISSSSIRGLARRSQIDQGLRAFLWRQGEALAYSNGKRNQTSRLVTEPGGNEPRMKTIHSYTGPGETPGKFARE